MSEQANRMFDENYAKAAAVLLNDFHKAWDDLSIYPDSPFQSSRVLLDSIEKFLKVCSELDKFSRKDCLTQEELSQWKQLLTQEVRLYDEINRSWNQILASYEQQDQAIKVASKLKKNETFDGLRHFTEIMQNALPREKKEFEDLLKRDCDNLEKIRKYTQYTLSSDEKPEILKMNSLQQEQFADKTRKAIDQEYKKMLAMLDKFQESSFFTMMKEEGIKSKLTSYEVMHDVIQEIVKMLLALQPPQKIRNISEFQPAWEELNRQLDDCNKRLND